MSPRAPRRPKDDGIKVEQLMTKDVRSCRPSDALNEVARVLWEQDCGVVPVVAEDGSGRVVGMVTDRDVCMAAYTRGRRLGEIQVAEVMAHDVVSCAASSTIEAAAERMRSAQVRRLPVVDPSGHLQGVLSLADLARRADGDAGGPSFMLVGRTLAAIAQPRRA